MAVVEDYLKDKSEALTIRELITVDMDEETRKHNLKKVKTLF